MKIYISILLCLLSSVHQGQHSPVPVINQTQKDPFFTQVRIITSDSKSEREGLFERVFNLIAGREVVEINTPVNVFAANPQNILILNQGDGSLLSFSDGKLKNITSQDKRNPAPLLSPIGICEFGNRGYLVTDSRLNSIFVLSNDLEKLSVLNEKLSLDRPTGIAFNKTTGEIWVIETGSHKISVLNTAGQRIKSVGVRGTGPLEFNFPTNIWIDKTGKVYIVDSMNYRIQILSSTGEFILTFGSQGDVTGTFARPRGIATDNMGNIYVSDALFNNIQIFNQQGNLLYYFGIQGRDPFQFWMPSGIFIDNENNIYVSDSFNSRIQIFRLTRKEDK